MPISEKAIRILNYFGKIGNWFDRKFIINEIKITITTKEKIMTLNITIPNNINDTKPRISVIGIGGAGGNAVNTMINSM